MNNGNFMLDCLKFDLSFAETTDGSQSHSASGLGGSATDLYVLLSNDVKVSEMETQEPSFSLDGKVIHLAIPVGMQKTKDSMKDLRDKLSAFVGENFKDLPKVSFENLTDSAWLSSKEQNQQMKALLESVDAIRAMVAVIDAEGKASDKIKSEMKDLQTSSDITKLLPFKKLVGVDRIIKFDFDQSIFEDENLFVNRYMKV